MVLRLAEQLEVPLRNRSDGGTMTFLSTTTVFGTAVDITLSELALECFYPADDVAAAMLRGMDR
jgi:hypothetical protein